MEQKKWSEMSTTEKKKSTVYNILVLLIAIPLIIFVISKCSDDYCTYNSIESSAQRYVNNILKDRLKYPDGWEYEKKSLSRVDSVTYKFTAIVLAKNGFGVRSKMIYNVKVEFLGTKKDSYKDSDNPKNWNVISCELNQ